MGLDHVGPEVPTLGTAQLAVCTWIGKPCMGRWPGSPLSEVAGLGPAAVTSPLHRPLCPHRTPSPSLTAPEVALSGVARRNSPRQVTETQDIRRKELLGSSMVLKMRRQMQGMRHYLTWGWKPERSPGGLTLCVWGRGRQPPRRLWAHRTLLLV